MRRMYDDMQLKNSVFEPVTLPSGADLDTITAPGLYKVTKAMINGVSYDGTLEVLGWDKLYFRQVFYTLENKDPNPIFTRVRVNQTHPWKAWELFNGTIEIDLKNTNLGASDFSELDKYFDILHNTKNVVVFKNFKIDSAVYKSVNVNVYEQSDTYLNIDFIQVPSNNNLTCYSVFGRLNAGRFTNVLKFTLTNPAQVATTLELKPDDYKTDGTINTVDKPTIATDPKLTK